MASSFVNFTNPILKYVTFAMLVVLAVKMMVKNPKTSIVTFMTTSRKSLMNKSMSIPKRVYTLTYIATQKVQFLASEKQQVALLFSVLAMKRNLRF